MRQKNVSNRGKIVPVPMHHAIIEYLGRVDKDIWIVDLDGGA
jgi:hypothetical protein